MDDVDEEAAGKGVSMLPVDALGVFGHGFEVGFFEKGGEVLEPEGVEVGGVRCGFEEVVFGTEGGEDVGVGDGERQGRGEEDVCYVVKVVR